MKKFPSASWKMNSSKLTSISLIAFALLSTMPHFLMGGRYKCHLPESWNGDWFEFGERDSVGINKTSLGHKGVCFKRKGDKYIFRDESQNCYRCAVMHQKHDNVIQYKESLCEAHYGRRPTDLCYSITADSPLKSLFRLNGQPSPCPLDGADAFSLTYSRGQGLCEYPVSSVSRCKNQQDSSENISAGRQLIFRYQACADIPRSESYVEKLQCLGSWKEGSTFFFLGLLNHTRMSSPQDWESRFRCYAYQRIFDGYLLSQSGEAKCNLYSATEGDRTMTLKKVESADKVCHFPGWMLSSHHQYHNLNQSKNFHFNSKGSSLTITDLKAETEQKFRCNSVESEDKVNFKAKLILQVDFECENGFVCAEVERKSDRVLTLKMGRLSRNRDEACNKFLFFDNSAQRITLISAKHQRSMCPLVGKYRILPEKTQDEDRGFDLKSSIDGSCGEEQDQLLFGCSGETHFRKVRRKVVDPFRTNIDKGCKENEFYIGQSRKMKAKESEENFDFLSLDNLEFSCHGGWFTSTETNSKELSTSASSEFSSVSSSYIEGTINDRNHLVISNSNHKSPESVISYPNRGWDTKTPSNFEPREQFLIISLSGASMTQEQRRKLSAFIQRRKRQNIYQRVHEDDFLAGGSLRLCIRLLGRDPSEKSASITASVDDCPRSIYEDEDEYSKMSAAASSSSQQPQSAAVEVWDIETSRISECAQALATANSASQPQSTFFSLSGLGGQWRQMSSFYGLQQFLFLLGCCGLMIKAQKGLCLVIR